MPDCFKRGPLHLRRNRRRFSAGFSVRPGALNCLPLEDKLLLVRSKAGEYYARSQTVHDPIGMSLETKQATRRLSLVLAKPVANRIHERNIGVNVVLRFTLGKLPAPE